jgi:hypothetical protein
MGSGAARNAILSGGLFSQPLQRFQNCRTSKPPPPSGIFLEKMPPFTALKSAREFWNRSKRRRIPHQDELGSRAFEAMIVQREQLARKSAFLRPGAHSRFEG